MIKTTFWCSLRQSRQWSDLKTDWPFQNRRLNTMSDPILAGLEIYLDLVVFSWRFIVRCKGFGGALVRASERLSPLESWVQFSLWTHDYLLLFYLLPNITYRILYGLFLYMDVSHFRLFVSYAPHTSELYSRIGEIIESNIFKAIFGVRLWKSSFFLILNRISAWRATFLVADLFNLLF